MIEVEQLTKRYGPNVAIEAVSFRVAKGEIIGFLGPNGAGKTTTMRILAGYMPATSGTARITGFDVLTQSLEARRQVGYLPENVPLYPEMSVDSYLDFVAAIKGVPRPQRRRRVNDVMDRCRTAEFRGRPIGKLSKGQRQRVGLAQALIGDPPVLILDEPTVGLDPRQIREARQLIKGLAGDHTVILSTHILPEVSMTCNRVLIINEGQLVAEDTPEGLTRQMRGSERVELLVRGPEGELRQTIQRLASVIALQVQAEDGLLRCIVDCPLSSGGRDVREELARTVVQRGWGLLELRSVSMSLEDVFLKLITREEGEVA
ncbi:MAG: ABC transporter ATP-binding protein [Chloroflexi bacterium]|nr:ABC transporter ATP-binding protein [Chloroflexota bacterium]